MSRSPPETPAPPAPRRFLDDREERSFSQVALSSAPTTPAFELAEPGESPKRRRLPDSVALRLAPAEAPELAALPHKSPRLPPAPLPPSSQLTSPAASDVRTPMPPQRTPAPASAATTAVSPAPTPVPSPRGPAEVAHPRAAGSHPRAAPAATAAETKGEKASPRLAPMPRTLRPFPSSAMQARERLAPSERLLQAFLAIGPVAHSKSQYHFLLGLHYLRMRRPGEAEASLRRALELWRASPLSPVTSLHKHLLKLRLTLSQSLWEMAPGDCVSGAALREAQSLIIQATQSDSKRADIWNSLGRLLFESNRVQLARGVYDLITESFPENMDLWNNLGLVHLLGLHDDEAAVRCLHRVLLNNKDHFEALNNYAVILLKEGLLRESSAVLEYALSINERQPQAWNHLALVYLRMGQDAKARVALSKARAFSEGDPEAGASVRFNLANHLMKVARKEGDAARQRQQLDAAAQLLEALPDKETSCEVQTAFGRLRAMQAEFASDDAAARSLRSEAQAAYERALAIHPASIAALNGLALLHTDSLAYDRAEQLLRSVLQRGITSANCAVMCNLGISLQLSHRLADAEFVYRSGIEMHPRSPQLRNNLGNLLRQSGRLAEAEAEYEAALKIDPKFAMALSNLALVKVVRDDLTAALDLLERALAEDPELLCARSNLLKVRALLARRAAPAAASLSSA